MSRERDSRIGKALAAMKKIGLDAEIVKPVLNELLKVSDHNWKYVEDENYQPLADAIFESMDKKEEERKRSAAMHDEEPRSKKSQISVVKDDESSSTINNKYMSPHVSQYKLIASPEKDPNTHLDIPGPSKPFVTKGLIHKTRESSRDSHPPIPHFDNKSNKLDIASSSCGNIKISLECHQSLRQNMSVDTVLKFVETNYLQSYNMDDPQFSIMKLLTELCEGFVQLLAGADSGSGKNKEPLRIDYPSKTWASSSVGSGSSNSVSLQRILDISKGTEKVSISLVNEMGIEVKKPNFVYISRNTVYQSAFVQSSLARISDEDCCSTCIEDCLSSEVPCHCARITGGEFAYTREGLLKEDFLDTCISMHIEPQKHYHHFCEDCPLERAKNAYKYGKCKGHLVRKFIKECWRKCGCNMQQCGNRVVQRGITRKLQVFLTNEGKGWGVRTLEALPKGALVCEFVGEILTNTELYERNCRNTNERHTYPLLLDADWGSESVLSDDDALCLDATYYGNVARFINHRCFDGNLIEFPVEIENPDHHYYHLAFFTKRKLNALEELTWDYGIDFDDHNHPIKAFRCCCGSLYCRDKKAKGAKGKDMAVQDGFPN